MLKYIKKLNTVLVVDAKSISENNAMHIIKQQSKEIKVYKNLLVDHACVWYDKLQNEMYSPILEIITGPKHRLFSVLRTSISETFSNLQRFIPAKMI